MRIYEYGKIGEAVRAKIENTKQSIQGGVHETESFSDILKGYMTVESNEKKVVSATGNYGSSSPAPSVNGSTLLYALQNSDDDMNASAVLSMLGFEDYSNGGTAKLREAADSLADSAALLIDLNSGGAVNAAAVSEFVTDYNNLITCLSAESSSSSYLYRNAFSAALTASSDGLSQAGITYENGYISYNGTGNGNLPEDFLTGIVSSASMVSAYSSSVISDNEENDNGVSDYYTSLISTMM